MKRNIIIIVILVISALNIEAYGKLDDKNLKKAKEIALTNTEINIDDEPKTYYGISLFELIHFAEILLIADMGRRNLLS